MLRHKKIALIGSGTMAEAMISGLIRNKLTTGKNILASDPREERTKELEQTYGIQPYVNNSEAACQADVVVLSIKPQVLDKVLDEIKDCLKPDVLILSIVAGAPIAKISQ